MKSFETYVLQHKHNLKNLRPGDKVKYVGSHPIIFSGVPIIKPNKIYTFIEFKEAFGGLYIIIREHSSVFIHPKHIVKI